MHHFGSQVAITIDTAKNAAIVILVVMVVIAFLVAKFVKSVTTKAVSILLIGGLMFGIWTQRQNAQDCADKVKAGVLKGSTTCTFFGNDVEIPGR